MTNIGLFINNEFRDSAHKEKIVNPATGKTIAHVAVAGEKEIEQAIASARLAFDQGPWRKIPPDERKIFLSGIAQGILDNAQELARIETLNTGKPIKESTFMDIPSSAKTFEHFAKYLQEYLREELHGLDNAESHLVRQPQGVAALIVPWNYPLLIACWKLAAALAAGNTVILKPASLTPLSVLELAKIIQRAGLPEGVVSILTGPGAIIGKALCQDKRVDMVSFTGSNEVGKEILGYSASHVKKLIMELGGKSASIILSDADLESAVNGSLCSIFLNQGQMCTAMSRILVEDEVYDKFIQDFVQKANRIKLGDGLDYQTQMGPLISEAQRKKVKAYVEKAKKEGASILCGGEAPADAELKDGFFFKPTIIADVSTRMSIFQEEVFGPVVCVSRFHGLDEAIKLANATEFGLAGSIWTGNPSFARHLAVEISAGIIWVNTYGMFYDEVPYGGFKQSGFGKELGREGLLEYTRLKNIIIDKTKDAKPIVNYWYGF